MLKNCRPSASALSRRLQTPGRVSLRLGGARLGPGWGPSCPCGVAPSGARSPAPGLCHPRLAGPRPRLLLVHSFGAPATPCVKPWRAPRYCQAAYCDSDEGVRPVGHSQRASPGTAAQQKTPPGYAAATARLTPRAGLDATAHRRQDTDAGQGLAPSACGAGPCVLTRRGCPILYVPAQCAPAKTEALLPKMGGEERGLLLLPSCFWEGRSVGRAGRLAAPAPGVATGHGTLADGRGGGMHWNR